MAEKIDPYFHHRLEQGKAHRVMNVIKFEDPGLEVPANKELAPPTLEGEIDEFGWSDKAVSNIIDALEKGYIQIERIIGDKIKIKFLPLTQLPGELGQVCELSVVKENLKKSKDIFGDRANDKPTYLQTADFAVEGFIDDESDGKEYCRIFVDSKKLQAKRNVYLDPESLHVTDYEYGYAFCIWGGLPFQAVTRIEVIKAKKIKYKSLPEESGWVDDPEAEMNKQIERLKKYLSEKL